MSPSLDGFRRGRIRRVPLLWLGTLCLAMGCGLGQPEVLCEMRDPDSGAVVRLYKEAWYKVPAGYDEEEHIRRWKEEQRVRGFTEEIDH